MRNFLILSFALLMLSAAPPALAYSTGDGGADDALVATDNSQSIQNLRANQYDLSRLRDLGMVREFRAQGLLVPVHSRMPYYYIHGVPAGYRYLRPWSKLFLDRLSREYYARFRQPLRITSMLRTVHLQQRLTRWNPNAADATGADRSSHLTGATLDISKHGMSARGQNWLRNVLVQLKGGGYLYAIEEFQEPCFHVMVFPTYRDYVAGRTATGGRTVRMKRASRARSRHAARPVADPAARVKAPASAKDGSPASKTPTAVHTPAGDADRTTDSPAATKDQ